MEQQRETTELAPGWAPGWVSLSQGLLEVGRYDEGREAWVNAARLSNLDVQTAREAYEALIRYRETGEPQTFPDFEGGGWISWLYVQSGQHDRAIETFEDLYVRPGVYGLAANLHVMYASDLLGGDPRYQALLEEAGITW